MENELKSVKETEQEPQPEVPTGICDIGKVEYKHLSRNLKIGIVAAWVLGIFYAISSIVVLIVGLRGGL